MTVFTVLMIYTMASGGEKKNGPSYFTALDSTVGELVNEIMNTDYRDHGIRSCDIN